MTATTPTGAATTPRRATGANKGNGNTNKGNDNANRGEGDALKASGLNATRCESTRQRRRQGRRQLVAFLQWLQSFAFFTATAQIWLKAKLQTVILVQVKVHFWSLLCVES